MKQLNFNKSKSNSTTITLMVVIFSILALVITLAVFQDFIFSRLKNTGFYISESLLFNFFWIFFLPLGFGIIELQKIFKPRGLWMRLISTLLLAFLFCTIHLVGFAFFFIMISHLVFDAGHFFTRMLESVVSSHFYIALLFYLLAPNVYHFFIGKKEEETKEQESQPITVDHITVKVGALSKSIAVETIQLITTDRPYTAIYTQEEKYLQDESLRDFEFTLDPVLFKRVHRSAIINKTFVKELASRKNGDYDALLENGQRIRFSRHFRENWLELLH